MNLDQAIDKAVAELDDPFKKSDIEILADTIMYHFPLAQKEGKRWVLEEIWRRLGQLDHTGETINGILQNRGGHQ